MFGPNLGQENHLRFVQGNLMSVSWAEDRHQPSLLVKMDSLLPSQANVIANKLLNLEGSSFTFHPDI